MDALVAMAQGWTQVLRYQWENANGDLVVDGRIYEPSSGNAQTYELIEKLRMQLLPIADDGKYTGEWEAAIITEQGLVSGYGFSTPAEAICKAAIASEWGYVIPDEIMKQIGGL